jgi:hypothetical protein
MTLKNKFGCCKLDVIINILNKLFFKIKSEFLEIESFLFWKKNRRKKELVLGRIYWKELILEKVTKLLVVLLVASNVIILPWFLNYYVSSSILWSPPYPSQYCPLHPSKWGRRGHPHKPWDQRSRMDRFISEPPLDGWLIRSPCYRPCYL